MGKRGNGEGSIYRREGDGKWCGTVSLGWVGGTRKRKTVYGDTRKAVADQMKALLRDQQQGLPIATTRQTVAQFVDTWLAEVVKPAVRPSTYASYENKLRAYVLPAVGRHQLAELQPQHVQAMMNAMLARGLAPRTVHAARAVLRRALGQALRWGLVARNVATLVTPPSVPHREMRALDPDQARRFLDAARGDRLEALYAVALSLGLRQGEALGLRWEDIDFAAGTLAVRVALQKLSGQPVRLVEPKTPQSRRTLPLPAPLVARLKAHRARQLEERLRAGEDWQDAWGLVFTDALGQPLAKRTVITHFKAHLARAGLPDIRFHDLRHSCASLLLAQGVQPRYVMEILGHSTITITMNIYAHVLHGAVREAVEALGGLLEPAATGD